jgi:hypothetical protein
MRRAIAFLVTKIKTNTKRNLECVANPVTTHAPGPSGTLIMIADQATGWMEHIEK